MKSIINSNISKFNAKCHYPFQKPEVEKKATACHKRECSRTHIVGGKADVTIFAVALMSQYYLTRQLRRHYHRPCGYKRRNPVSAALLNFDRYHVAIGADG